MSDIRVAIVGYGLAGRCFHAPLIAATDGLTVSSIVTGNAARARQAAAEHPEARVVPSVEQLWAPDPPELVVVATANDSHVPIASGAIEHGVPVVIEKPVALTAAEAQALAEQADRAGVMLTVFQNRRWDTDQLTLRRLIAQGALGEVTLYESRFERWRPQLDQSKEREMLPPERGGGVLLDLGVHLIDQALTLFGPVAEVYAETHSRRGAPAEDDAFVALRHAGGTSSHLYASLVTPAPGPRLRVQGTSGGFLVPHLDPQEAALRAGARPDTVDHWGRPQEWEYGRLIAGERSVPVPPEPGDWPGFYARLRDALGTGAPPPVDPRDAVQTLRVLEAARRAARERRIVVL